MDNEDVLDHYKFKFENEDWDDYPVQRIINTIRKMVPADERDYDDQTGEWYVSKEYKHTVERIWEYHQGIKELQEEHDAIFETPLFIEQDEETGTLYLVEHRSGNKIIIEEDELEILVRGFALFYEQYSNDNIQKRNELMRGNMENNE